MGRLIEVLSRLPVAVEGWGVALADLPPAEGGALGELLYVCGIEGRLTAELRAQPKTASELETDRRLGRMFAALPERLTEPGAPSPSRSSTTTGRKRSEVTVDGAAKLPSPAPSWTQRPDPPTCAMSS